MEKVGVVIPVGEGRHENLTEVMRSLEAQTARERISSVAMVADGEGAYGDLLFAREKVDEFSLRIGAVVIPKHEPGLEQPRNVGVRFLEEIAPDSTHVWFMDTDVIVEPDALEQFATAHAKRGIPGEPILVGPYDWLPPGLRQIYQPLKNDPRWPSFYAATGEPVAGDLSAGLACFSGNLIWPIERFKKVGGFWNAIHHGRCEDGELGLRAVAMGVPILFVPKARGYHLDHPRNSDWINAANARDVPMLNARHPWVEKAGMFVVEEDGKRFDVECPCGWKGNTALIWQHQENECPMAIRIEVPDEARA